MYVFPTPTLNYCNPRSACSTPPTAAAGSREHGALDECIMGPTGAATGIGGGHSTTTSVLPSTGERRAARVLLGGCWIGVGGLGARGENLRYICLEPHCTLFVCCELW